MSGSVVGILPTPGRATTASLVSNSVTSFKTCPLADSSVTSAATSRDSLNSQHTATGSTPVFNRKTNGLSLPPLETAKVMLGQTLPSPPPSASPTEKKSFDQTRILSRTFTDEPEQKDSLGITDSPESLLRPFDPPVSKNNAPSITSATSSQATAAPNPILAQETFNQENVPSSSKVTFPPTNTGDPSALLYPPSSSTAPAPRPTRRNTTGSGASRPSRAVSQAHSHMSVQMVPGSSSAAAAATAFSAFGYEDPTSPALENDILKEAEQIRRERRAKAQQEAEAALTAAHRGKAATEEEESKPAVGNIIGEGHVNYVLMYNMLTGIRVAVSRCQAKIKRPLTDEDYTARHKYSFDIGGNELTPSAKYDFKFKDYAPFVFRELREEYFALDPADYLLSLTAKYILAELGSPGKSGSFFYFSRDYRFIIKTIHYSEHKFLRRILKDYHNHVKTNPHTLISRFYGLHRVKLPHGRKIHFVIMNNLFPPHRDIHETYDLKGSTVGREYPEEKLVNNPRAVMKDLNWINRAKQLELGPEKRAFLTEQIRRDVELLKKIKVMDYSLLIGIHNMQRGNRDNPHHHRDASASSQNPPAILATPNLPDTDPDFDNRPFLFYQDEGGYKSTDEMNQGLDVIYYLGIIDILTPWTLFKRVENIWKGFKNDRHKISPVPSSEYGDRFFSFMQAIMRGGEGGEKFKEA
ncbi:Phosphatidylinositol-4-phosphate 5-kinase [Tulasnella sp. 418]|nr:Phosphatidylinositol-4-phosphate 5-kinase [Tulasnella sp. 418]